MSRRERDDDEYDGHGDDDGPEYTVGYDHYSQLNRAERTGLENISALIKKGGNMSSSSRALSQLRLSSEEKFRLLATAYYERFGPDTFILTWEEISNYITLLGKKTENRHPMCFIIGLRILNKERKIDREKLAHTFDTYADMIVNNEKIGKADAVRYARFWQSIL